MTEKEKELLEGFLEGLGLNGYILSSTKDIVVIVIANKESKGNKENNETEEAKVAEDSY